MNCSRVLQALSLTVLLASCEENAVQTIAGPAPSARVKFYNFGVNAPGVNFYADATKMTAISSTTGVESTSGVAYGAVGSGGFYSALEPGTYAFTGKIAATTDKDLIIATVNQAISDGRAYSYFMSGFYNTVAKTSDAFVVLDDFGGAIDYTVAYVRFVHALANANPMTLYATDAITAAVIAIGGELAYKEGGAFTAVPAAVYNLGTRYAGVTTNAIARTAVSFVAGRVYTVSARGDITVTSTTATNRPFLDNTANR